MVVFGIVFSVIIYRLAIGTLIYSRVSGTSLGPAVGSIIVSVTGAIIQLIAILIMNKVYEKLATVLTEWGVLVCVLGFVELNWQAWSLDVIISQRSCIMYVYSNITYVDSSDIATPVYGQPTYIVFIEVYLRSVFICLQVYVK